MSGQSSGRTRRMRRLAGWGKRFGRRADELRSGAVAILDRWAATLPSPIRGVTPTLKRGRAYSATAGPDLAALLFALCGRALSIPTATEYEDEGYLRAAGGRRVARRELLKSWAL